MQLVDIEDRFVMIKRAHTMDDDNHNASSLHHDDNHQCVRSFDGDHQNVRTLT